MGDTPKVQLSFRALQLANEQRSLYGLRYNDHNRYRKHCANRTHRIRSSLKITHGKGREFKKHAPIPLDKIQDGHLQLLLFEAERAWSYSQELLTLASQPANEDKASALRHNATGRFRRAVHWSTQLLSQCQTLYSSSRLGAQALLEITVYTLVLNGRFLRYRDEFEDALIQLAVARSILDELASAAQTSRDQALATYFADEIGPEIRYCAHELRNEKAYDVDNIVSEIASQHRNELVEGYDELVQKLRGEGEVAAKDQAKKKLASLMWEGEPVPVRNPELVDVLLKVQEGEAKLKHDSAEAVKGDEQKKKGKGTKGSKSKRGVAAYDNILLALSDAEEVARKLEEAQKLSGSTSVATAGARDITFVHTYIVYHLLSRRIQRDLLLISTLLSSSQHTQATRRTPSGKPPSGKQLKPQKDQVDARLFPALVKLLVTVLQSLNQMRALSIVDESPDLATAVDARISFTSARRCLYLASAYAPVKKYGEALTLIQRGQIHLRESRSLLSTVDADLINEGDPTFYPISPATLDELDGELVADGLRFKNEWFAFNGGSPIADNRAYRKPLFFDIALNYVQLDMDRLQERAGVKKPVLAAPVPARAEPVPDKRPVAKTKAKLEEELRAATPEPKAPPKGGLSNLLGGWW
ncbi:hypothetical protein BV25DRAFT_450798 [Artomyces pyxidatus]|uniref:Uncharacterized protein n=1 Tax=Artomyces pyxidatus TaxID=48021 RepID=A0ACB8T319_9AGAM|nr:hypothetical protein BV25DRAFT_450798 [Artomyces pyxidatus]